MPFRALLTLTAVLSGHVPATDVCGTERSANEVAVGSALLQKAHSRRNVSVVDATDPSELSQAQDGADVTKHVGSGMTKVEKAVFENKCAKSVWVYGKQNGQPKNLEIKPGETKEFTEAGGFVPWRDQRIWFSWKNYFDGRLNPVNENAVVVELNADYNSFTVPKSHVSFLGQLGYGDLNLEIAMWADKIGGTLAAPGNDGGPACFSRAKTTFRVADCNFADGSGKVQTQDWGKMCMPVCPSTGQTGGVCQDSCYTSPGKPVDYAAYISKHSLAWRNGAWMECPATTDLHKREGAEQFSATFECWDSQTGPEGFPICFPSKIPDTMGVWQMVTCPDDSSAGSSSSVTPAKPAPSPSSSSATPAYPTPSPSSIWDGMDDWYDDKYSGRSGKGSGYDDWSRPGRSGSGYPWWSRPGYDDYNDYNDRSSWTQAQENGIVSARPSHADSASAALEQRHQRKP